MEKLQYKDYQDFVERLLLKLKEKFGSNFVACALFGSVARGEGRPESDVDLLMIFKNKTAELEKEIIKLLVEADDWSEKEVLLSKGIYAHLSVVLRTEKELREDPLIMLDVMDQGIVLYEKNKALERLFSLLKSKLRELKSKKVVLADGTWYWDLKPDWHPGEIVELKL
jgi:predicted nucleotidyltransferase